jgi:aliphatic sulfonates family ABC transporter substrate-binding protein
MQGSDGDPMPVLELSRTGVPPARARALVFEDPISRDLLKRIERVAPTDATVLITGETGTGKEIVARHVHDCSLRARAPFVAVNCGALTPSLIESELFGHEKGSFTGAFSSKPGWFEVANGGTLFLDEIADLPFAAQVKLLRVLQEHEVVRIGARRPMPVDVRLLVATNANLEQAVADEKFREDLYYRLHVVCLALAPLRDRPLDLVPLSRHFLAKFASRLGIEKSELTEDALDRLFAHHWPGNIRELENTIHHALLVAKGGRVTGADLRVLVSPARTPSSAPPPVSAVIPKPVDARAALESSMVALFKSERPNLHHEIEEILFRTAYAFSGKNQLRTARLLGVSRNVVRARLLAHGILSIAPQPIEAGKATPSSTVSSGSRPLDVRIGHQSLGVLSLLKATCALEDALTGFAAHVEWVECATGMDVIDALAAGTLDLGLGGEVPPVFAQAARAPVIYLAAEPRAPDAEAIVVPAQSPVRGLADLRGKSLAVSRGASAVYLVVRALEEVGLTLADIDICSLSPRDARAAFASGKVDAWAVWNPHLALLRERLPIRVLRDACGLASNRAFHVGHRGFAEAHPDVVNAFLAQVSAVGRWANNSPAAAARALAPYMNVSASWLEASLARDPFDTQPLDGEAVASQQRIADALHRVKLIPRAVNVEEVVWKPTATTRRSA